MTFMKSKNFSTLHSMPLNRRCALQLTSQPASQSRAVWLSLCTVQSQQVQSTILGEKGKFRCNEGSIIGIISVLYKIAGR